MNAAVVFEITFVYYTSLMMYILGRKSLFLRKTFLQRKRGCRKNIFSILYFLLFFRKGKMHNPFILAIIILCIKGLNTLVILKKSIFLYRIF